MSAYRSFRFEEFQAGSVVLSDSKTATATEFDRAVGSFAASPKVAGTAEPDTNLGTDDLVQRVKTAVALASGKDGTNLDTGTEMSHVSCQ